MTERFERDVVAPVRRHLGGRVRLPAVGRWELETRDGNPLLRLRLPHARLGVNLQKNPAASPFFLWAFGWWLGTIQQTEPALHLVLEGPPPSEPKRRRHARRAWIALEALQAATGDRLVIDGLPAERWPSQPVFNQPRQVRDHIAGRGGREHKVEAQLCRDLRWHKAAPTILGPLAPFRRQLPLGLFEGEVKDAASWTPGGSAQADLWTTSPDGQDFHLFELKIRGNAEVGIVPELLAYLWLLHRARVGLADGTPLQGGGPGIAAARQAQRLHGWFLVPKLHKLLWHAGDGPIRDLAQGLAPHLGLGLLTFEDRGGDDAFGGWRDAVDLAGDPARV